MERDQREVDFENGLIRGLEGARESDNPYPSGKPGHEEWEAGRRQHEDIRKRNPNVPLIDSVESCKVYYYIGEEGGDFRVKECAMTFYGPMVMEEIVIPASRLNAMRVPSPEEWAAMRAHMLSQMAQERWKALKI